MKIRINIFISIILSCFIGILLDFNWGMAFCFFLLILFVFLLIKKTDFILICISVFPPFNQLVVIHAGLCDIRIMQLLWCIVIVKYFIENLYKRKLYNIRFFYYDIYIVIFIFFCFIQALLYKEHLLIFKETLQWIYLYSIFVFYRSYYNTYKKIKIFSKFVVIVSIMFSSYGILKFFYGKDFIPAIHINLFHGIQFVRTSLSAREVLSGVFFRTDSFLWGPVGTANILLIQYFMVNISPLKQITKLIVKFLIILVLVLTASRAAWIFFISLYFVEIWLKKKNIPLRFIGSVGIVYLIFLFFPWVLYRFLDTFSAEESSNIWHIVIWSSGIEMFKSNPLWGIGTGCFAYSTILRKMLSAAGLDTIFITSHNMFLKLLSENGLLGFGLWLMFFISFFNKYWNYRFLKKNYLYRSLFFSLIGTILMNLTMNAFMIEIFWIILGVFVGAFYCCENNS